MRRAPAAIGALGLVVLASCEDGVDADLGLDASLQVEGGTFRRGAPPTPTGGPDTLAVGLVTSALRPGATGKPCTGALGPGATAAIVSLAGDRGYWIVPAGAAAADSPGAPTFSARLAFSSRLAPGAYALGVQAVDGAGRIGASRTAPLVAVATSAPARFAITLTWDTQADLDLHVVDPSGVEIFDRNMSAVEPPAPGKPVDLAAYAKAAYLDFDSNAECVIDGLRRESVLYPEAPARGRYVARVDTKSTCGFGVARWRVTAVLDGRVLGTATGASTDDDARFPHDRGAGVLALEVDVP